MPTYKSTWSREGEEEDYPLRSVKIELRLSAESHVPLPGAALQRLLLRELRRAANSIGRQDLHVTDDAKAVSPLSKHDDVHDLSANGDWQQPDLDLRVVKSVHRLVAEVADRGGVAVMVSKLTEAMSAPTLSRLTNEGEPGFEYASKYLNIVPAGRTKALTLNESGRALAGQVKEGAVPS